MKYVYKAGDIIQVGVTKCLLVQQRGTIDNTFNNIILEDPICMGSLEFNTTGTDKPLCNIQDILIRLPSLIQELKDAGKLK